MISRRDHLKYLAATGAASAIPAQLLRAAHQMLDNLGAGVGELPDIALQKRMAEYVDALPSG